MERVAPDHLAVVVPPEYRSRVQAVALPAAAYTVVLFAHDRRDVVTSAPVRRALSMLPSTPPIVAVGADFTAEAIALLQERGAAIARLGEFYWTDESYHSLPR